MSEKAGAMPQKCERAEKLGHCPRNRKTADDRQRRKECAGFSAAFQFLRNTGT